MRRAQFQPVKTVLVVDDHHANRILAETALTRLGHHVVTAENGSEAVSVCRKTAFDTVFMDIQMPVMNGLEAMKAIRSLTPTVTPHACPKMIAMTGFIDVESLKTYKVVGFDGLVTKPCNIDAFSEALEHPVWPNQSKPSDNAHTAPAIKVDINRLNTILSTLAPERQNYILDIFFADMFSLTQKLEAMSNQPGHELDIQKTLHSLKGLANNFGARTLSQTARNLQQTKSRPTPDQIRVIKTIANATRDQIKCEFSNLSLALNQATNTTRQNTFPVDVR